MSGLTKDDLTVLHYYADNGMRERYWNYLANHKTDRVLDADRYGELALSVVRNDSMPGKIANNYAQNYVENHPINGKNLLSEREWEKVGVDLIKADLTERQKLFPTRPDLALNLPVEKVYDSHINAFNKNGIDPKAWTPAVLVDASIAKTGNTKEANQIWGEMLNSDNLGLSRLGNTLAQQYKSDVLVDKYFRNQTAASIEAVADVTYSKPDTIRTTEPNVQGKLENHWYQKTQFGWIEGVPPEAKLLPLPHISSGEMKLVSPQKAKILDESSEFRKQRNNLSDEPKMHKLDPNKEITRSKFTLADNTSDRDSTFPNLDLNASPAIQKLANLPENANSTEVKPTHTRPEGGYPIPTDAQMASNDPLRIYNQETGTSKLYTFNSDGFLLREQNLDINGNDMNPTMAVNKSQELNVTQQQPSGPKLELSFG